jgi:hypothetical protein
MESTPLLRLEGSGFLCFAAAENHNNCTMFQEGWSNTFGGRLVMIEATNRWREGMRKSSGSAVKDQKTMKRNERG